MPEFSLGISRVERVRGGSKTRGDYQVIASTHVSPLAQLVASAALQ